MCTDPREELLERRRPLAVLAERLRALDPDEQRGPQLVLELRHVVDALSACAQGRLAPEELVQWMDLVESAVLVHGVDYQAGHEDVLSDLVFRLSTPEIHAPVTADLARRILGDLDARTA